MKDRDELPSEQISLEASRWFTLLERDELPDQLAFYTWLRRHPAHVREFLELTWIDVELRRLRPTRELSGPNLIQPLTSKRGGG